MTGGARAGRGAALTVCLALAATDARAQLEADVSEDLFPQGTPEGPMDPPAAGADTESLPVDPPPVSGPGPITVDTSDSAVPGSVEVLVDTPAALTWSRFQAGTIAGWSYRLFPDGSAYVFAEGTRRRVDYLITCDVGASCTIEGSDGLRTTVPAIGAPPPDLPAVVQGPTLARYLAEWILAGTGAPPPPPAPARADPPAPVDAELPQTDLPADDAAEMDTEAPAEAETVATETTAEAEDANCIEPDPFYPDACTTQPARFDAPSGGAVASLPAVRPVPPRIATAPAATDAVVAPVEPEQTLAERFRLACSVNTGATLRYSSHIDQSLQFGKLRIGIGCSARLTERASLRVSYIYYPVSGQQAPWDADFTYALNFRLMDGVNLSYSNYSARFSGSDTFASSLTSGDLRVTFRLPPLDLTDDLSLRCSLGLAVPDPTDGSASLSCGMTFESGLRLGATAYAYAAGTQSPYSPDYSYTASYPLTDRLQISYSNYTNNRFPWNPAESDGPGPLGGSVSLSYALDF